MKKLRLVESGGLRVERRSRAVVRHLGVRWQSEARAATPPWEAMWDRLPACRRAHGQAGSLSHTCPPEIASEGGVALTLPAALQGFARGFVNQLHFLP